MSLVGWEHPFANLDAQSILPGELQGWGMSVPGREHPFADLGVHSILTVEIPSRGMTGTE